MSISINQLLKKMESELHKAKQAEHSSHVRESVHSIKILCELILEQNGQVELPKQTVVAVSPIQQPGPQAIPPANLSGRKLQEEEANGESLFDF
jgi:hypothetical protein